MEEKIIQIMMCPQDEKWQNRLLGLSNTGVVYEVGRSGRWETFVPPLAARVQPKGKE